MNRKYFFFDIDGTLTDNKTGKVVESAKQTIQKLKDNGHFVAIATGRAYYKTIKIAKEIGVDHIVSNGGAAITINNELIENKPLPHDKAVAICKQIEELGYGILIATNDSIDVTMLNDHFINQVGFRKEPTRYFLDKSLSYENIKDIYKIYISIPREKEVDFSLLNSLGHIRFVEEYLTFQHDRKDEGIKKVIKYLNGRVEDVVVFGDDYNDLVMFNDEWTSIAMGNACEELKQKASFITKENIDNGIQYACQHFGWIEKVK
ncbi:MAG: HAD-IIB family hydrolase [Coprobacillus sp.]